MKQASSSSHRNSLSIYLILFLVVFAVGGCVGTRSASFNSDKTPRYGGTINYFLGEPSAIDPAFAQESEGFQVLKQVFDGLIDYDAKTMSIKPAVAGSWRSNPAGDLWTFFLRDDVKFHNGRVVTADDFIYAWNRATAKKTASPNAYHLASIQGFDKVQSGKAKGLSGLSKEGRFILKVKLNYSFAEFPIILGHPVFSPVPKEEVEDDSKNFSDSPVGNGPFAVKGKWLHGREIALIKFKSYYGEQPYLTEVVFKISDNPDTAFLEFKGGALDYALVPPGQIKATRDQYGKSAKIGEAQLKLLFFGFNGKKSPFKQNKELRQAINYAVDRRSIAKNIFEDAYLPTGAIVPPALASEFKRTSDYSYSPAKARKLLKKAGYPEGKGLKTIKLVYPAGGPVDAVAQSVQEDLRAVGVNLKLEGVEFGEFLDAMRTGSAEMFAGNWQADYPSRDSFLYPLFYSKSSDNVFGFSDKKVDKLLLQAREAVEPVRRKQLFEQAESRILLEAPLAPLAFAGSKAVFASRVKGAVRTPLDDTPLDRVWLSRN